MLSYKELYKNIPASLEEYPNQNLVKIFKNESKRIIMESLLLDPACPKGLFRDLFGLSSEEVEEYKNIFFALPEDLPRLDLLEFIESLTSEEDIKKKTLFLDVFYNGWSSIDKIFNRNKYLDLESFSLEIFKIVLLKLKEEIVETLNNNISDFNITKIKSLVFILKEGINMFSDKEDKKAPAVEQLVFDFVNNIKSSAKKVTTDNLIINGAKIDNFGYLIESNSENPEYEKIKKDLLEIEDKINKKNKQTNA